MNLKLSLKCVGLWGAVKISLAFEILILLKHVVLVDLYKIGFYLIRNSNIKKNILYEKLYEHFQI